MGMYTQVKLNIKLKEDTPYNIMNALDWMIEYRDELAIKPERDEHPLFCCERVHVMLRMNGSFDDWEAPVREGYNFSCLSDVKAYDGEWYKLMDYLSPWVDAEEGEILGTYHYEEELLSSPIKYIDGILMVDYLQGQDDD